MKKIILSLLVLCSISAVASTPGTKRFGKVKANEEILVGVEGKTDIDIEDGYKVNQMMAGFVKKNFVIDANSTMSNAYIWVETQTGATTIHNLHIYGKHRYNLCVSNNWTKGFASVIVHMPKVDKVAYPTLYDWHLLYVNPDEENFPSVIYYKQNGDGISYVTPTNDDPFKEMECKAYFCSFVEFCGKGRYLTVSMEMP